MQRYQEALRILQNAQGTQASAPDYRIASIYNNMSALYQRAGAFQEAADCLQKALKILQHLTESEIETAITYSNLAGLYLQSGQIAEAQRCANEAESRFRQHSGDRDVHYAAAVSAQGEVAYAQGDFASAAAFFEKALQLTERDYGCDNDAYRTVQRNLQICREALQKETAKQEAEH